MLCGIMVFGMFMDMNGFCLVFLLSDLVLDVGEFYFNGGYNMGCYGCCDGG